MGATKEMVVSLCGIFASLCVPKREEIINWRRAEGEKKKKFQTKWKLCKSIFINKNIFHFIFFLFVCAAKYKKISVFFPFFFFVEVPVPTFLSFLLWLFSLFFTHRHSHTNERKGRKNCFKLIHSYADYTLEITSRHAHPNCLIPSHKNKNKMKWFTLVFDDGKNAFISLVPRFKTMFFSRWNSHTFSFFMMPSAQKNKVRIRTHTKKKKEKGMKTFFLISLVLITHFYYYDSKKRLL